MQLFTIVEQRYMATGSLFLLCFLLFFVVSLLHSFPLSSERPARTTIWSKTTKGLQRRGRSGGGYSRSKVIALGDKRMTEPSFVDKAQAYWKAFQEEYGKEKEKQASTHLYMSEHYHLAILYSCFLVISSIATRNQGAVFCC